MIKFVLVLSLTGFSALTQLHAANADVPSVPSYPTPILVGDVFQFVEGSWGEYELYDKNEDSSFILRMSILGTEQVRPRWFSRRRPYRWLEFEVTLPDEPRVIVKYLAEETPEGPGEPHEMILQIEEFENPLRIGRRMLARGDEVIVDDGLEWVRHQVDEEVITHDERSFTAWRVTAETEDGDTVEAVVSMDLPPFGLYFTETAEMRMQLLDCGMDASSQITGEPLGLTRWITRIVRDSMREE